MARTRRGATRPQRLTSVQAAADYADVSTRSIRRWIAAGLIPGYRVGPRLVKIDLDDLDRLARQIPTAGKPARVSPPNGESASQASIQYGSSQAGSAGDTEWDGSDFTAFDTR